MFQYFNSVDSLVPRPKHPFFLSNLAALTGIISGIYLRIAHDILQTEQKSCPEIISHRKIASSRNVTMVLYQIQWPHIRVCPPFLPNISITGDSIGSNGTSYWMATRWFFIIKDVSLLMSKRDHKYNARFIFHRFCTYDWRNTRNQSRTFNWTDFVFHALNVILYILYLSSVFLLLVNGAMVSYLSSRKILVIVS